MTHLTHRIPADAELAWRTAVLPGTFGERIIIHGYSLYGFFHPLDGGEHRYIDSAPHPYLCPATSPAYDCGAGAAAPQPAASGTFECAETRFDERGDCDAGLVRVEYLTNLGQIATRQGEEGFLCGSHARQALIANEVRLVVVPALANPKRRRTTVTADVGSIDQADTDRRRDEFVKAFQVRASRLNDTEIGREWFALAERVEGAPITAEDAASWANLGYMPGEAERKIQAGVTISMAEHADNPQRARIYRHGRRLA